MANIKGGRGLKAPYETTHMRVPVPVKEILQQIIDSYKETLDPDAAISVLSQNQGGDLNLLTRSQAIELAHKIIKQKKGAKISIERLLSGIYKENIEL
jgi:NMD protein affecting ribosome stability and mRNA decay